MSIKEALEREPMHRGGTLLTPESQLALRNKDKVLEAGLSVHREAHVPDLLKEVADLIRPQFPDVKVSEPTVNGDFVGLGTWWNFRKVPDYFARTFEEDVHDEVQVEASFLTKDLVVRIGYEEELLSYEEWSTDRMVLEGAIARAYQTQRTNLDNPNNPDRMFSQYVEWARGNLR